MRNLSLRDVADCFETSMRVVGDPRRKAKATEIKHKEGVQCGKLLDSYEATNFGSISLTLEGGSKGYFNLLKGCLRFHYIIVLL